MTKKHFGELFTEHGPEELTNSFIFPVPLSKKQRAEADAELNDALSKRRAVMSKEDLLKANLLQLRFQIEDYVINKQFDKRKTFGHFLKTYIDRLNKKRNEFAAEIQIKPAELSQYINNHRMPPKNVMIRLELHSHKIIPATDWYRLVEKENLYELSNNKALRAEQKQFVIREAEVG